MKYSILCLTSERMKTIIYVVDMADFVFPYKKICLRNKSKFKLYAGKIF